MLERGCHYPLVKCQGMWSFPVGAFQIVILSMPFNTQSSGQTGQAWPILIGDVIKFLYMYCLTDRLSLRWHVTLSGYQYFFEVSPGILYRYLTAANYASHVDDRLIKEIHTAAYGNERQFWSSVARSTDKSVFQAFPGLRGDISRTNGSNFHAISAISVRMRMNIVHVIVRPQSVIEHSDTYIAAEICRTTTVWEVQVVPVRQYHILIITQIKALWSLFPRGGSIIML